MKQIVQDVRSGATQVKEIPDPIVQAGQVLVATRTSVISAGTERYVVHLARKSLLGKARERPADVTRVLQKMRQEGIRPTLEQVGAKLDEPMPLGYSAAGVIEACGHGVQDFKPGDRVASATPHSAVASIGHNLCARIPNDVTFEQGAYASIAAIGLEGVRLTQATLGESVLVIGLGLIGQICVCLLKAQGCRVFGTDLDPSKLELAKALGADTVGHQPAAEEIRNFSGGFGVGAAVLTAATESNGPIELAAEACRTRGRIVLVGMVGLNIPRPPFFKKELEFTVSSSLGPGRGDPIYEEKGIDYPPGVARWTAQRNMQTVLQLMSDGKLPVERLTSHKLALDNAPEAYDLITTRREPFLGIVLEYGDRETPRRRIDFEAAPPKSRAATLVGNSLGVSVIGAGNFARLVMLPALGKVEGLVWRGIATARGMSAESTGQRGGFAFATTDISELMCDADTRAIFIATRHDMHADLVITALAAGKHVFVEKPLCIDEEQLRRIAECVERLGEGCPILTVGFNRRFAPGTNKIRGFFADVAPLSISHRFAVPYLPAEHWTQDPETGGGRIIGEACHAIDTCTAIAGSAPMNVYAESVANTGGLETTDDRVFITLRHGNGSISSVSYQAGGDKAFPMERIEVLGGGKSAVLDNWNHGELWQSGKCERFSGQKDKGHANEFRAFVEGCRTGVWPIPWEHLYGVTAASLRAVRSLREGLPFPIEQ